MADNWLTGAMMVDMAAIEVFLSAKDAMNSPNDSGATLVFMPVETAAALQAEVNSSDNTGASTAYVLPWVGNEGGGPYPI